MCKNDAFSLNHLNLRSAGLEGNSLTFRGDDYLLYLHVALSFLMGGNFKAESLYLGALSRRLWAQKRTKWGTLAKKVQLGDTES